MPLTSKLLFLSLFTSSMLSGCASTLLDPHELEAMEQRKSAKTVEASQQERLAAGFMARYGLDPDERQEFIEEIAADQQFVLEGKELLNDQLESFVAEQLYDQFSEDAIKLALKNNMSLDVGVGAGFIGALVVSDLLFSKSGNDYVGGINLPLEIKGRVLEDEKQANNFIGSFIERQMNHAAETIGYRVHKEQVFNHPAKEDVPPIDVRVFWLTPDKIDLARDQPAAEDLVVQVTNMHVVRNNLESISPLLISSLGFVPVYSIPTKYIRGFGITFLEEARFTPDNVFHNEYVQFSTAQKRNLVKHFIDPHGYFFRGQFKTMYNSGYYFSFKGENYAQNRQRAEVWMRHKLAESPVGVFRPKSN